MRDEARDLVFAWILVRRLGQSPRDGVVNRSELREVLGVVLFKKSLGDFCRQNL